jgi:hypothetical protein
MPHLAVFRHAPGATYCEHQFDHYTMPDGQVVHLYAKPGAAESTCVVMNSHPAPPTTLAAIGKIAMPFPPPMLRAGKDDGVGSALSHHPRLSDPAKVHEHGLHGLHSVPWFTGAPPAAGGDLFLPPRCATHTLDLTDKPFCVHFRKKADDPPEEEAEEGAC